MTLTNNDESEDEKQPPLIGSVETALRKEFMNYSQKFEFPINPAFFNSTNIRQPPKMTTLSNFLKDQGIATTLTQSQLDERTKIKIQYRFWKHGIDSVIPGYRDQCFVERLIKFIEEVNFSDLTE